MNKFKMFLKKIAEKKDKEKRISVIFAILTLIIVLVPLSYAIYKNVGANSSAVVLATWNVTLNQTNEENHLSIVPSPKEKTASYTLNVTSQSEVDIIYSVELSNLPSGVSVSADGVTFYPEDNHKATIPDVDTILHNAQNKTKSTTLIFKASPGATYVDDQEVSINVVAKQIVQGS